MKKKNFALFFFWRTCASSADNANFFARLDRKRQVLDDKVQASTVAGRVVVEQDYALFRPMLWRFAEIVFRKIT